MEKLHLTKKMSMVLLAMVMLWSVACKRDQLPPGNSLLNTYRGTDKMVLKVVEALKEPANQTLLADLEKQGNMNWKYETLITSRFLKGYTLRFATGSDGNYLDAEVNAETGVVKLFSKQMQQQRDALSKQYLNSELLKRGNGTLNGICNFDLLFELRTEGGYSISLFHLEFIKRLSIRFELHSSDNPRTDFSSYLRFEAENGRLTAAKIELWVQEIAESLNLKIVSLSVTNSCGDAYDFSDYDLSSTIANNIIVHVQAPFPPDILHKVDILDRRSLNRPLSDLMFSFKYLKARPTAITDFNFISTSVGIDYTLAEPMSVSSIIYSENMINIRFKIKQSVLFNGFPFSKLYWCFISYNYYSESATVSYLNI